MRVWYNRTFSSINAALKLIREADTEGRFTLIYSNPNRHTPAASLAHEFHTEPTGLTGAAYLDWTLEFCRRQRIDIFVAGREATMLAEHIEDFQAIGTRLLCAALAEQLKLIHDKARFYATTTLPDTPVAQFRHFETLDQFDAAYAELRAHYPKLCIKPSHSIYGLGFAIVDEKRSSAELLLSGVEYHIGHEDLRRGLAALGQFRSMLLMEYLDGPEYSVDCVGDKGRLVTAVVRRKLPQSGSGQLIDMREDILASCHTLCQTHQLSGVFNVQFREREGRPRLLEINPRMSGGVGMACLAGPNLPYIALRGFADGFDKVTLPPVANGMRVMEINTAVELP